MKLHSKVYFASDFHLGIPDYAGSLEREKSFVRWLDFIRQDAEAIYLLGDIFDFWFEYKSVVPKGYVRLLGKLAEITDSGIPIYLFRGNHDIWTFGYLEKEIGITLLRNPKKLTLGEKVFYLAHGDGLGKGDNGYKLLKKVFESRINQWLFRWLHPDIGAKIAQFSSDKSRYKDQAAKQKNGVRPVEQELLFQFSNELIGQQPDIDYLVFGHLHRPVRRWLSEKATLIILGDWMTEFSYAVFDGHQVYLKTFAP